MTRPDPDRPRDKAPVCDTGKGSVALDGTMAGILGITSLALLGSSNSSSQGTAIVPAIFGAIYIASAVHGNSVANECRKAMEEYAAGAAAPPTSAAVLAARPQASGLRPQASEEDPRPRPRHPKPAPAPDPDSDSGPEARGLRPEASAAPAAAKAAEPATPSSPWIDFWKEVP